GFDGDVETVFIPRLLEQFAGLFRIIRIRLDARQGRDRKITRGDTGLTVEQFTDDEQFVDGIVQGLTDFALGPWVFGIVTGVRRLDQATEADHWRPSRFGRHHGQTGIAHRGNGVKADWGDVRFTSAQHGDAGGFLGHDLEND